MRGCVTKQTQLHQSVPVVPAGVRIDTPHSLEVYVSDLETDSQKT